MIMTVVLGTINTFFAIASYCVHAIILLHSDDIGKHSVKGSFARVGGVKGSGCTQAKQAKCSSKVPKIIQPRRG